MNTHSESYDHVVSDMYFTFQLCYSPVYPEGYKNNSSGRDI